MCHYILSNICISVSPNLKKNILELKEFQMMAKIME